MTWEQRERIEALYLEMYGLLFLYACNSFGDEALAEEAIQEAFRIACMKPDDFLSSPNPRGWIINTLKYTMQNMRRNRDKNKKLLTKYLANRDSSAAFSKDRLSLEVMYGNVANSEEFRLIKELAVEGKSHREIARSRGISVDACRKRVQRAKAFLRRKI